MQRRYPMVERPLSSRDYDVPVGWWGWNWDPPVPLSVSQIIEAGNLDPRTAALCWMVLEAHGSLLIAAELPHSGKTTTLTAFLDCLPNATRRVFLRGWAETFDFLKQSRPAETLLLANELSPHLSVYLWGAKAVEVFRALRHGYALGSTLHADSAEEAVEQLTAELGVAAADLARVDLLMVMRLYTTSLGGYARRLVSLHRLVPDDGRVRLESLVTYDADSDEHKHNDPAQLALLAARRGADDAQAELERRAAFLRDLVARRCRSIAEVREALAGYRGERVPTQLRGDPTE